MTVHAGKISVFPDGAHWTISNFTSFLKKGYDRIRSPLFTLTGINWMLFLSPNSISCNGAIRCFEIIAGHHTSISSDIILEIGISNEHQEIIVSSRAKRYGPRCYSSNELIRRSDFDLRKNEIMPDGNLHVFFRIVCKKDESTFHAVKKKTEGMKEESTQTSNNANAEKSTQTEEELVLEVKEQEQRNNDICIGNFFQDNRIGVWRLIQDFQNLLQKESVTDVVIKMHGQEFKAHRCVLAARSPVFLAMMSHDTKEKNTGVVDIKDVDLDAIPDFLHYLYTGNVENLSPEKALKLYSVADKYQVVELKQQCMDHLLTNITVDNFCDAITLSLQHNETQLKDACIDFFQEKSLDIVMTTRWQNFLSENPIIGNELFIKHLQLIKSILQEAGKQIKTRDDNSS